MSLTQSDLQQIEAIFDKKLEPIFGKLEALENDIKEIYKMISGLQRGTINEDFRNKPAKERVLILHAEVVAAARELGVKLPQS